MAVTETAFEQLYLELINQARTDPGGAFQRLQDAIAEDPFIQTNLDFFNVNLTVLEQQFSQLTAVAPLAWSDELHISAETHSQRMLDQDAQEHFFPGEPGLLDRIRDAGYQNISRAAENIFAFDEDPLFGHTAFFVDWGFDAEDIVNGQVRDDFANFGDGIQDPAGHRNAIMGAEFQEIGVAGVVQTNPNADVGPIATTQHFAARFDYLPQFLGVVFNDGDGDEFYDIGEGLANVDIVLQGASGTFQTQSSASGGWQIEVPAGQYTITFSGQGLNGDVVKNATLANDNVKVDAQADEAQPANGGRTEILGDAGNNTLLGGADDEILRGFDGNDILSGRGGSDILEGGAGFDRLNGGEGADQMSGGAGDDIYTVDNVGDEIIENPGEGTRDRINVFVDFTNPENVEFLVGLFANLGLNLTGSEGRESITGANRISTGDTINALGGNDRIVGLVGNDEIDGGLGNDRIFGNSGHDIISGGDGNDRLTGQFGQDRFVHNPGDDRDRITDFDVTEDLLDLTSHGFANFGQVQALLSDQAGGAFLDLAGADGVLFEGVAAASIGSEDVLI